MKTRLLILFVAHFIGNALHSQSVINDPEADSLLQLVSTKYKSYKNISADFKLVVQKPKFKPTDNDKKLSDTLKGNIIMQGTKFKVVVKGEQIICDGKTTWTFIPLQREVQVNDADDNDDVFSPTKIFTVGTKGYVSRIKEDVKVAGKSFTVIELMPLNKKLSYFKMDVTVDNSSQQITEALVYEKSGTHYIYIVTKQTNNVSVTDETFNFDSKKHPGVKVVDLR